MKIAVTGSSGFIGRAVLAYLDGKAETKPFDHKSGDSILDPLALAELDGCDAVIHLAGVLGTDELFDTAETAIDVNIKGTLKLLRQCQKSEIAYVGITMPQVWDNIYQATKNAAMRIANAFDRDYGVPVSHVLAYNVYGPGQACGPGHPKKLFPTVCSRLGAGLPVQVWGDGEQTIDLVHVDHVAMMLGQCALEGAAPRAVFEAGSGKQTRVLDLIYRISDYLGVYAEIEHLPMRRGETPGTKLCAKRPDFFGYDQWDESKFQAAIDSYL